MSAEKMREFDEYWDSESNEGLRRSCAKGWALRVWQDSRSAIELELPKPDGRYSQIALSEVFSFRDEAVEAIESLGLKVKPC